MARTRLLKPGFFESEVLAELPHAGRLLFAGLWTLADREGRLEDRPKRIKGELFRFDGDVAVDGLLADLAVRGFIARYQVEATAVIQITKFHEHQHPHKNEPASKLPPIPETLQELVTLRERAGTARAVINTVCNTESDTEKDVSSTPPLAAVEPPFLVFPCVGKAPTYGLPLQQVVEWEQAYPDTDVIGECRKALAWIVATPGRRKTAAGIPRFLVNWLNRAVDSRTAERRQAERRTPPTNYRPTLHDEYDHWREDCHRDHNGECGNFTAHEVRKMRTA
jgi:hypothetical protein